MAIKQLMVGVDIMTDAGWSLYVGNIHAGSVQPTLIIYTKNSSVELTLDHLIKNGSVFIHASSVAVGDILTGSEVTRIHNGTSHVTSPLTKSGTLVVNGFVLSCYANVYSHTVARISTLPVSAGIIANVSMYFQMLAGLYNNMPKFVRRTIAHDDVIYL